MPFTNRTEAGRELTKVLIRYKTDNMLVLALPRGGVPVGYEIALTLDIPLDILLVRKLGVPGQEELAMGAIGPDNVIALNEDIIASLGIEPSVIQNVIVKEERELERRLQHFRGNRPFPDLAGKTVIVVDDGIATGSSALAAIQTIRRLHPKAIILATPVSPPDALARLRPVVDHLVCLESPTAFMAVGQWYRDFQQVTDAQVVDYLSRLWRRDHYETHPQEEQEEYS